MFIKEYFTGRKTDFFKKGKRIKVTAMTKEGKLNKRLKGIVFEKLLLYHDYARENMKEWKLLYQNLIPFSNTILDHMFDLFFFFSFSHDFLSFFLSHFLSSPNERIDDWVLLVVNWSGCIFSHSCSRCIKEILSYGKSIGDDSKRWSIQKMKCWKSHHREIMDSIRWLMGSFLTKFFREKIFSGEEIFFAKFRWNLVNFFPNRDRITILDPIVVIVVVMSSCSFTPIDTSVKLEEHVKEEDGMKQLGHGKDHWPTVWIQDCFCWVSHHQYELNHLQLSTQRKISHFRFQILVSDFSLKMSKL